MQNQIYAIYRMVLNKRNQAFDDVEWEMLSTTSEESLAQSIIKELVYKDFREDTYLNVDIAIYAYGEIGDDVYKIVPNYHEANLSDSSVLFYPNYYRGKSGANYLAVCKVCYVGALSAEMHYWSIVPIKSRGQNPQILHEGVDELGAIVDQVYIIDLCNDKRGYVDMTETVIKHPDLNSFLEGRIKGEPDVKEQA